MLVDKRTMLKGWALASALALPGAAAEGKAHPHRKSASGMAGSAGAGLLATWYDLEPGHEDEYLAWVHSVYCPAISRRPGYEWVAHYRIVDDHQQNAADGDKSEVLAVTQQMRMVDQSAAKYGQGRQFLMLSGAADPKAFISPFHAAADEAMGGDAARMLGFRRQVRTTIFTDVLRQPGPARVQNARGMPTARIQLGGLRPAEEVETDLLRWYVDERFPVLDKLQGMVSTRLMAGCAGWEKLGVLYEFADKAAHARFRHAAEQLTVDNFQAKKTIFPLGRIAQAPYGPTIADRIWPVG